MSTPMLVREEAATDFWGLPEDGDHDEVCIPSPLDRLEAEGPSDEDELRDLFEFFASEVAEAALGASSTRRVARHPAFQDILVLGEPVIPLLIERLDTGGNRPIWLRLLGALTGFQPGAGAETV